MSTHAALTTDEMTSARAIRAALDNAGRLRDADAFRAAAHASREQHGEDRHNAVKFAAMHMKASA